MKATILGLVLGAGTVVFSARVVAQEPVEFADPKLKAVVERELGPDPTPDDMLRLRTMAEQRITKQSN